MIKLQVIGHLGKDCVVNQVNGKSVINFNVAHSYKYKDAQGTLISKTTWVSCAWWTDRITIAQYLKKGTQVYVEGEPETDFYNAGGEGLKSVQKCRVAKLDLLGSAKQGDGPSVYAGGSGGQPGKEKIPLASEVTEPIDDLPF